MKRKIHVFKITFNKSITEDNKGIFKKNKREKKRKRK